MWCNHEHHQPDAECSSEEKGLLERRSLIQGLAAGGLLTVSGGALTGCVTNAETGSRQLLLVGDSQLSQMAAGSWLEAKSKVPTSNDPRYTNRLSNIGGRISRGANKENEKWDYAVFDSQTKNAFVLPGNRVGFYKGMMDFADNDDQIAAIMGHEVGHVTGKHAAERVSTQMSAQFGVAAVGIAAGRKLSRQQSQALNAALGMGLQFGLILPFSRNHESQSDLLGAKYMHKAGYDAHESVKLWEKMADNSTSRQPEFMSTHPDPSRRARDLHNYIRAQEALGSQGWESIRT